MPSVRFNKALRGDEYWGLGVITQTATSGEYNPLLRERGMDKQEMRYNPKDKVNKNFNHCAVSGLK